MKKCTWLCLFLFCLLASCHKAENTDTKTGENVEGFAMLLHSEYIFCCDLPENWEYAVYPNYSGDFFWQKQVGELDTSIRMYFHYSEMPDATIVVAMRNPGEKEPFSGIGGEAEEYTFADGGAGMRKLIDGEYYYKEYIYHPEAEYYVSLVTSKEDYQKNEKELRSFLDSISFEKNGISEKESGNTDKLYHLHIWNEDLQAELMVRAGISVEAVWEWKDRGLVFQYITLCSDESGKSIMKIGENKGAAATDENGRQWKRCTLGSGCTAYYDEFEEDGQKGMDYTLIRSGCHIKVYGEETEELSEMLQSIKVR